MITEHKIPFDKLGITPDRLIILSVAGSHMYGTDTENSDVDYLGIYVPTKYDILMNKVRHHLSLPKESGIDLQIWSIHRFLDLIFDGDTMTIDLLHSPESCWLYYDVETWWFLRSNKASFYTKKMEQFIGFARKQAAKYGVKGSRLNTLQTIVNFLEAYPNKDDRLKNIWENLPNIEHVYFLDVKPYKMYQVCGTKFQETVTIEYILTHLKKILTVYGKRAIEASNNEGIDWKAVSHAIRSAIQVYDILTTGYYVYPLDHTDFITKVKLGEVDYKIAESFLEGYIKDVENLIKTSTLQEEPNKKFWENWLYSYMKGKICEDQMESKLKIT